MRGGDFLDLFYLDLGASGTAERLDRYVREESFWLRGVVFTH